MMLSIDELLALVAELGADAAGMPLVLMGGLAVHVRTRTAEPLDAPGEALARPAALAGITRPTKDIDVCVPTSRRPELEALLRVRGFERSERLAFRFHRGEVVIDILDFERARFSALVLVEGMTSPVEVGGYTLGVASPAALVATKCNAHADRGKDGDLVDIARLALSDYHELRLPPILRWMLDENEQLWPVYKEALDAFADADGAGPDAYVKALLDMPLPDRDEWLEHEIELRAVVALAVQRMFSQCPMSEDEQ